MNFTLVADDIIITSTNNLNTLVNEDLKNWDIGISSCKNLADALRSGNETKRKNDMRFLYHLYFQLLFALH